MRGRPVLFLIGPAIVIAVATGILLFRSGSTLAGPIDPASMQAMALSPRMDGTTAAPDFSLTDQHGRLVTLSSFRGRPVVLTFLDPHCVDVCPIISTEFVAADRLLGHDRGGAAIVAVNVNPFVTSPADMLAYSRAHQMESLGNFTFATGSPTELGAVWRHYGVFVDAPSPSADVVHTSVTLFIDRTGVTRYLAMPYVDHRADGTSYLPRDSIFAWARGIAEVTRSLEH